MNFNFTPHILTGKSRAHLCPLPCPLSDSHYLQADALKAFCGLQQTALKNGFNLQPASSFRDFTRQQTIWNDKFNGKRKVHDDNGVALDLSSLSDWEKIKAVLRWSAMPGASRHHWGTEIDIFSPDLLPPGQSLQLEPWEYEQGGYFFELSEFLQAQLAHFDFTLPFLHLPENKHIGREPWHISYQPVAEYARCRFTPDILLSAWENEEIAGQAVLIRHMNAIFEHFWV